MHADPYNHPNTYNIYYLKDMQLVVFFCDPVKRAFAQWEDDRARAVQTRRFAECMRDDLKAQAEKEDYAGRGMYGAQLEFALTLFPRDQMLMLREEDFFANPAQTLMSICEFLSIPCSASDFAHLRTQEATPPGVGVDIPVERGVAEEDMRYMRDLYKDDLEVFRGLSGLDVSDWLTMRVRSNHAEE